MMAAGGASAAIATAAEGAATALPSLDLAYCRLLVGGELLASNFYAQALAAALSGRTVTAYLRRAAFNEQEHYTSVAAILSGAGAVPAVAGDITFSYPSGTFASEASIVKFAFQLETTLIGAYLGAIAGLQTSSLSAGLSSILACEAEHCSYFSYAGGGRAFDLSFPPALSISDASDALSAFTA